MSLYNFFFPEQAQAEHLEQLVRMKSAQTRRSRVASIDAKDRFTQLESDMGYIALVLGSILQRLDQKGVVTREDVKAEMAALDGLDGVSDGRLDVQFLRGRHT